MGEKSFILRLVLILVSLAFQFIGFIFCIAFGCLSIILVLGRTDLYETDLTIRQTIPMAVIALVLLILGRVAWRGQRKLKKYHKAYMQKLKAGGKADLSNFTVLFTQSHEYTLIYDYTNVFLRGIMEFIKNRGGSDGEIKIEPMGDTFGIRPPEITELPEGFLIFGRDKKSGIGTLKEKVHHVIKGRPAVDMLIGMANLPSSWTLLMLILYFIPGHDAILYRLFMGMKKRSPTTPMNLPGV